jgi:Polysaccharide lyase
VLRNFRYGIFVLTTLALALAVSAPASVAAGHGRGHTGGARISNAIVVEVGHHVHASTARSFAAHGGETSGATDSDAPSGESKAGSGHAGGSLATGSSGSTGTVNNDKTETATEPGPVTSTGSRVGGGTLTQASEANEANVVHGEEPASAFPIFQGDFDNGFGTWKVLQSMADRTTIVSASPDQGTANARFEVREGDVEPATGSERAEVTGPTFEEGADIYISDAVRVPVGNTFQGSWQLIQQLHDYGEGYNGSPGMGVFLENPARLRLGPGNGSQTFWTSPNLETEHWYKLVYHVKLSRNPTVGFAEVWLNGVQQPMTNGQLRVYGQTMNTTHTYLKAGIYRSQFSTGTSIVEHDDINVGTSLAAVSN